MEIEKKITKKDVVEIINVVSGYLVTASVKDDCDPNVELSSDDSLSKEYCNSHNFGQGCKYKSICPKYPKLKHDYTEVIKK